MELVLEYSSGFYDLLMIWEKTGMVTQYRITTPDGPITDMEKAFGWTREWTKLVATFNWRNHT